MGLEASTSVLTPPPFPIKKKKCLLLSETLLSNNLQPIAMTYFVLLIGMRFVSYWQLGGSESFVSSLLKKPKSKLDTGPQLLKEDVFSELYFKRN